MEAMSLPDESHDPPVLLPDDLQFFSPSTHSLFPSPPPLPSSADLFSPSEATDFFGFLENFNWELNFDTQNAPSYPASPRNSANTPPHLLPHGLTPPHHQFLPEPPLLPHGPNTYPQPGHAPQPVIDPALGSQDVPPPVHMQSPQSQPLPGPSRPKPLLSTPQKRLNHILSEQKRRNAIKDGYMQLTTLLAPAGAPPGTGMPTRGRPKGSGGRGRGTKGKSGILLNAREYIHFLEENRNALLHEVTRVEAAAGIRHQ